MRFGRRAFSGTWTRDSLAVLTLLAMFARALIPVGYMPALVHGQTQMVICGAGGDGARAHHTHSGGEAPCPFAMSCGAAPLPAHAPFLVARSAPELRMPFIERSATPEAPLRHTAPRGPPALV